MANTETKAKLRNLHIAPRKVRLVANLIKGMPVNEALAQLMVVTSRSADPIIKLLRSAASNAKSAGMKVDNLVVKTIFVDQGPMIKRILPRAQGRATPIHKKMSHITLVLAESTAVKPNRFDLTKAEKKAKKDVASGRQTKTKTPEAKSQEEKAKKPGFFKRTFQRKAI
jgi:large subunit ribosomal protein L22